MGLGRNSNMFDLDRWLKTNPSLDSSWQSDWVQLDKEVHLPPDLRAMTAELMSEGTGVEKSQALTLLIAARVLGLE
jgi:hypothetical protein